MEKKLDRVTHKLKDCVKFTVIFGILALLLAWVDADKMMLGFILGCFSFWGISAFSVIITNFAIKMGWINDDRDV